MIVLLEKINEAKTVKLIYIFIFCQIIEKQFSLMDIDPVFFLFLISPFALRIHCFYHIVFGKTITLFHKTIGLTHFIHNPLFYTLLDHL